MILKMLILASGCFGAGPSTQPSSTGPKSAASASPAVVWTAVGPKRSMAEELVARERQWRSRPTVGFAPPSRCDLTPLEAYLVGLQQQGAAASQPCRTRSTLPVTASPAPITLRPVRSAEASP